MVTLESKDVTSTLRILTPHPGIYAYYDGRTGHRFHSEKPNWLDDGAFTLGVATYAVVSGTEALIFDAHITTDHAGAVNRHLRSLGVKKTTVVYSHHHRDHIAGAIAFPEAEFISHEETAKIIKQNQKDLAQDDPPITAVVPSRTYTDQIALQVGDIEVELHHFIIHTLDGTVLWIPSQGIALVGDTLEDTVTFISEPAKLPTHRSELKRLARFPIKKILPAHGSPERIASGGYDPSLIEATLRYLTAMDEPVDEPVAWKMTLSDVVARDIERGDLIYFEQYEEVHKANIELMQTSRNEAHENL